jgi:nucleotide-binding universal stress UspA family protein
VDAETYLETAGVSAELVELVGDPGAVIAKTADEGAYDAVLVGSDRVGGLARAIFGSVPTYVAAHTRAMVIIVH